MNAKGLVCEGMFTPAVTVRTLSRAPPLIKARSEIYALSYRRQNSRNE